MIQSTWAVVLPAIFLTAVSVKATEISLSDEQIRNIASQWTINLAKRDSCRFTPDDLYESAVMEIRARLNQQQKTIFSVAVEAIENDPTNEHLDYGSASEVWCKDAKEKLRKSLGK
jgi:hypothetical protein